MRIPSAKFYQNPFHSFKGKYEDRWIDTTYHLYIHLMCLVQQIHKNRQRERFDGEKKYMSRFYSPILTNYYRESILNLHYQNLRVCSVKQVLGDT